MSKNVKSFEEIVGNIKAVINKLMKRSKEFSGDAKSHPFTDLTPFDNADSDGTYAKALSFALQNPRVKNIAITGPYGSGKSSIIRTYEKKNKCYKFLTISLASFKEYPKKENKKDSDESEDAQFIERSILQQMLYGANANKLPYSRFKRISTPEQPLYKSMVFVLWVIATILLYNNRFDSLNYLRSIEGISLSSFFSALLLHIFVVIYLAHLVSKIYKASFGLSLKKISLRNAEIEAGEQSKDSILNRHLDEIIYFFQVAKYDVVVIEDLDRFENPEIFIKLREINKIINDNDKTSGQIKFLYALKDDMFVHKNRAKFFDFIIPVIPIINTWNSLDMMQQRLVQYDFAKEKINIQFLREVSLYIDDFRLIHNIFNEFVIYYERLESKSLDITKLLAMMIYKNVYPNDFENLHHGRGVLFDVCQKKGQCLREFKNRLNEQLEELRTTLKLAETEKARNIRELIDAYIGHIVSHHNSEQIFGLVCNNQHIAFSKFITFEQFKPLLEEKNIFLAVHPQAHPNYRRPINKSFSQIEAEINPGETFLSRKENIENKPESKKNELKNKIQQIEKEIAYLPHMQFSQILQRNDVSLDDLVKKHNISDGNLLLNLIRDGHLNDNYHLYISNFYEGRLSKNDHEYLLIVRNLNQPDPNHKIDTPQEVCENLRWEDFEHKYVLNVILIDYLLENAQKYSPHIKSAIRYISKNFEQSEEFFTAYFISGKQIDKFIRHLSKEWPDFTVAAVSSKQGAEQISYILKYVDVEHICAQMNKDNQLTVYLSENGQAVFASNFQQPDDYEVLKKLEVCFHDLASMEKNETVIKFAHNECLYVINSRNINYILQKLSASQDSETMKSESANYTSILASGSENLKVYIKDNLSEYIEKVFLTLPNNVDESESTIKLLVNDEGIVAELKEKIISRQNHVFMTFEGVPESLWLHLLLEKKVVVSWKNISEYFKIEDHDKGVITKLLERENIVETLSNEKILEEELGENSSQVLSRFIFENNEINDSDYSKLIRCLPYWYEFFPKHTSKTKNHILVKEKIVRLAEESFSFASNDFHLLAILIEKSFSNYSENKEKYPINDNVREMLLSSELKDKDKINVCIDVTPEGAEENKELSRLIANLIASNDIDLSKFNSAVLSSAIANARPVSDSIRILTKCLPIWDETAAMEVISKLLEPFNEIAVYGNRPKIPNNKINLEFAKALETKGFISSLKKEDAFITINTFKSNDHAREEDGDSPEEATGVN